MKKETLLILLLLASVGGCTTGPRVREGGGGKVVVPGGTVDFKAPDNPATTSSQSILATNVTEVPLFPGTSVVVSNNVYRVLLSTNAKLRQVHFYKVEQRVGASQEDLTGIVAEKVKSMQPIVWVGIVLILLGVAQVHPTVFLVFGGSRSFQILCFLVGGVLAISPSLVIGNEKLILFGGLALLILWWLARRYGEKDGVLLAHRIHPNMKEKKGK